VPPRCLVTHTGRKVTSIREDAAVDDAAAAAPAAPVYKASTALPFLECPPNLDGSLAGDVGKWSFQFGRHQELLNTVYVW
jgi:hypothetical protein